MPVESSTSRAQYATNATTGPWTVPFYFFTNDELSVTYTDATGADSTLILDVDFSVSGAGNQDGGTVTTTTAYASGGKITIERDVEATQETRFVDGDPMPADSLNEGLDKLTMIAQQLRDMLVRSIAFPASYAGSAILGDAATRKGKLLGFANDSTAALAYAGPTSGSAAELALELSGSLGATLVGHDGITVDAELTGRLRDVRTFPGIVADGVADDFLALQAAAVSARDGGYGIFWPKGVKTFVQFSTTHPYLFVDGPVHWEAADRYTSGIIVHCNYEMTGHAPLFCWGIPSLGANVNKVSGHVRNLGFWLKAGSQRFERLCHLYGFKDFTVSECYADLTAVTWPAADGGHLNGYQAGGWWSSNYQPTFAVGQTRDENFRFLHNVGYASAEYQNAESVGITNCYVVEFYGNRLEGWSDDMAVHSCTSVRIFGNHMKTVAGRYFVQNSRHVVVSQNHIEPIPRPIVGGYLGTTRTYIGVDMSSRTQNITDDTANANVTISENTIYLPSGCYASPAIACYGVQDGLFIEDNILFNDGATSPTSAVLVSTSFRAGWTGPLGNPDFGAGGAVRLRSFRIEDNLELGAGWASNEGSISTAVYTGGASSDILGPGYVDRNTAGSYSILHEPIVFGEHNRALPVSTAPFQNVSAVCIVRNPRPYFVELKSASQLEATHHPIGSPQPVLDAFGLPFAAQADGSVRGVVLTLTAAMAAGNACTVSLVKNGSLLGSAVATSSLATANTNRYLANFSGIAMTFVEGDSLTLRFEFSPAQTVAITGKAELMVLYE